MPVAPGPEYPARTVPPTPGGQEEEIMGKVSGNWITGMHSGRASSPCWYLDASAGRNRFLGVDSHRPVAGALHHTPRHPRLQRIDSQYWDEEMMVILSSCQIVKLSNCQIVKLYIRIDPLTFRK